MSHLLSVLHQVGGSTIDGASYTVDAAGNRTAKTDWLANVTSNYGYDQIYELLSATQGGTTTESYTYDPVGNRLSSLGLSPYQYNVSNELTQTPNTIYGQDANGNTTLKTDSSGSTTYTWDYENRLASVTLPNSGGTVTFKYDPLGRRIQKSFTQPGSPPTTTTTNYAYDGADSVEEVDQNGNILARYARTSNIDEPLAMLRSGAASYYQADGLGSVTSLSNASGSLAETYTFDSFGKLTASSGSVTNSFRYTAREFDIETGLYYYRARYYDSNTGQFLSEDPARFTGGLNFYDYVLNNPLRSVDPFGLSTLLFNRYVGTLTLYDKNGNFLIMCLAANNTTRDSGGPWPNGMYWYQGHHDHAPDPNGPFGTHGIFVFDVPGRPGMGVHSGRANRGGPSHPTHGCVRTTDACMQEIVNFTAADPLEDIWIHQ